MAAFLHRIAAAGGAVVGWRDVGSVVDATVAIPSHALAVR